MDRSNNSHLNKWSLCRGGLHNRLHCTCSPAKSQHTYVRMYIHMYCSTHIRIYLPVFVCTHVRTYVFLSIHGEAIFAQVLCA